MNRYAHIALVFVFLGLSCEDPLPSQRLVTVTSKDSLYQMDLPANMKTGFDMHDYASLQYYDTTMEYFVIGIEDAKENLGQIKRRRLKLKGYFKFVENTVFAKVDTLLQETEQIIQLTDNLKVQAGDYYAQSKAWGENPVFYRIAIYENQDYFFQLVSWMPYYGHCERMNMLDSTLRSFIFMPDAVKGQIGVR